MSFDDWNAWYTEANDRYQDRIGDASATLDRASAFEAYEAGEEPVIYADSVYDELWGEGD